MSLDPDLLAWLLTADRDSFLRPDLLTVQPRGKAPLRWTSADRTILTPDGRLFKPGPGITRSKIRQAAGIQVSDMDITLAVDDSVVIGGLTALAYAERGGFDGARVTLEWAYFDNDGVFKGLQRKFGGMTGPAQLELGQIEFKVRGDTARLNAMVPREVYQPACLNQVYDGLCGLDVEDWRVTGVVTSVGTGRAGMMAFTAAGISEPAGYFDLGAIEFRDGPLEGVLRTVKQHAAGGVISVAMAWPALPEVGDTFVAVPGCNRTEARCINTFNNRLRFRGTPYVPAPETVA